MILALLGVLGMSGCDAVSGDDIQPLPPLSRPSPEARAGLPEVAGEWGFAGWDYPIADTAGALADLAAPGELLIQTQRLDSLAGVYVAGAERFPMVGEVRRDGVVALVAYDAAGQGWFIAGRLRDDTLWVELTSLAVAETWPAGTHAAYVRDPAPDTL